VNLLYGHTWKFNAGWTLKDVVLLDWVDQLRDPSHRPRPFYLDYLLVLDISRCTGRSRRISLWRLFKEEILHKCLRGTLGKSFYRDFDTLVQFFPPEALFVDVWNYLFKEGQEVFKAVTKEVLATLRSTGIDEDGYLQAWDITSSNRQDGKKIKPSWGSMVKDDSACATFAIITDKCVRYVAYTPPPSPNRGARTVSTILCTTICITTPDSLPSCESQVYTPPTSVKEEDVRPE
jgi:hypothetical protein